VPKLSGAKVSEGNHLIKEGENGLFKKLNVMR